MNGLRNRYNGVTDSALAYLKRDTWLGVHPQAGELIEAVKKWVDFAKSERQS